MMFAHLKLDFSYVQAIFSYRYPSNDGGGNMTNRIVLSLPLFVNKLGLIINNGLCMR